MPTAAARRVAGEQPFKLEARQEFLPQAFTRVARGIQGEALARQPFKLLVEKIAMDRTGGIEVADCLRPGRVHTALWRLAGCNAGRCKGRVRLVIEQHATGRLTGYPPARGLFVTDQGRVTVYRPPALELGAVGLQRCRDRRLDWRDHCPRDRWDTCGSLAFVPPRLRFGLDGERDSHCI